MRYVAVVKNQDKVEEVKINEAVRQECTLPPIIFNEHIQE